MKTFIPSIAMMLIPCEGGIKSINLNCAKMSIKYDTVWLVISVGFKFSWILCALPIHEKLLNFSYITK